MFRQSQHLEYQKNAVFYVIVITFNKQYKLLLGALAFQGTFGLVWRELVTRSLFNLSNSQEQANPHLCPIPLFHAAIFALGYIKSENYGSYSKQNTSVNQDLLVVISFCLCDVHRELLFLTLEPLFCKSLEKLDETPF